MLFQNNIVLVHKIIEKNVFFLLHVLFLETGPNRVEEIWLCKKVVDLRKFDCWASYKSNHSNNSHGSNLDDNSVFHLVYNSTILYKP